MGAGSLYRLISRKNRKIRQKRRPDLCVLSTVFAVLLIKTGFSGAIRPIPGRPVLLQSSPPYSASITAAFISRTYRLIGSTQSSPYFATSFTMALPTITPSAAAAMRRA